MGASMIIKYRKETVEEEEGEEKIYVPGKPQCWMSCGQRAGSCPGYCGKNGYCCSGEDPNDPRSWLAKHGGNGNCPSGAVIAQQNRPDSFPGYACVAERMAEGDKEEEEEEEEEEKIYVPGKPQCWMSCDQKAGSCP